MKPAKRVQKAYENLVNETLKATKAALKKKDFKFLYSMNSFTIDILSNVPYWLVAPGVITQEQATKLDEKLMPLKATINKAAGGKRLKKAQGL